MKMLNRQYYLSSIEPCPNREKKIRNNQIYNISQGELKFFKLKKKKSIKKEVAY